MKLWKTIFLGLLLCLNFAIATPALADKPNFQKNPDYLEITDNLTKLFEAKANKSLPEGLTASEVDQKIARLQLAKYIIENNDVKVAGLDLDSAVAVKVLNGTKLVIKANPDTGVYELNLPPAKVFKAGEANWDIPDLTQASLDVQYPKAPVDE